MNATLRVTFRRPYRSGPPIIVNVTVYDTDADAALRAIAEDLRAGNFDLAIVTPTEQVIPLTPAAAMSEPEPEAEHRRWWRSP